MSIEFTDDAISIWWVIVEHAASLFEELDQYSKRAGCMFYQFLLQFSNDMTHQIEIASPGKEKTKLTLRIYYGILFGMLKKNGK